MNKHASLQSSSTSSFLTLKKGKTKVLNPATRALEAAIVRAHRTGDFTDLSLAISSGADLTLRTSEEGLTALIAAASHLHLRLVTRLLAHQTDVLVADVSGRTAIDWARCAALPGREELRLEVLPCLATCPHLRL
jgi:ankyrin repeat protein